MAANPAHQVYLKSLEKDYERPLLVRNLMPRPRPSGPSSVWPDETNTGVPPGTALTPIVGDQFGNFTTSFNGQVVDAISLTNNFATLLVKHSNVTVKRCKVAGSIVVGADDVPVTALNCLVTDCTLTGNGTGGISAIVLATGGGGDISGTVVRRCDISGVENGFHVSGSNCIIEDNYLHNFAFIGADPHVDGLQSPGPGITNITIRHNNIEGVNGALINSSCIAFGTGINCTVTNNRLHGGTSIIYMNGTGNVVSNNLMIQQGGAFVVETPGARVGYFGNYDQNGTPILLPEGFPSAANTGPQSGVDFTNTSGELRTTANGQFIQGLRHNGYILVMHNNVTIQDCIITSQPGDIHAISPNGVAVTGILIRRCKIVGNNSLSGIDLELMDNSEVASCDISNVENGIFLSSNGSNVHDNYIHGLSRGNAAADELAHFDCIQGFWGNTNWTINHNTLIGRDTSGIIAGNHNNTITTTVTITNNLFMHDFPLSYGMHLDGINGLTVTGNRISVDFFGQGAGLQRPIFPIDLVSCPTPTVSGNVHHESGAILTPSIS